VTIRAEVNDTTSYYESESPSLMWEMTICQSLADETTAAMGGLDDPEPYGRKLGNFLSDRVGITSETTIIELGGGYGTLMAGLLGTVSPGKITMVDICPRFVEMQRERLGDRGGVDFVQADMFEYLDTLSGCVDIVIANENIGDLLTVDAIDAAKLRQLVLGGAPFGDDPVGRVARLVAQYRLDIPSHGPVALNLGALELVEKLAGRTRCAFLSEHSCDVKMAEPYDFLENLATGQPRRIELKDHAEYSIRFDHLETLATAVGFKVERVPMVEFLGVRSDEGARFMSRSECVGFEAAEVMHEFINHVKEYECLLLTSG
jgi:SAM-dependent methyltransferase